MRGWKSVTARKVLSLKNQPITRFKRRNHGFAVQNGDTKPDPQHDFLQPRRDPYALVAPDLTRLRGNLLGLLGSAHPGLSEVARYYFVRPSKQLRSLVVLLFSRVTNGLGENWEAKQRAAENEVDTSLSEALDRPLKQPDVLNNWHPNMPNDAASFESVFDLKSPGLFHPPPPLPSSSQMTPHLISPPVVLPTQTRLAQIVEMIHIASCLHDEIFDPSACDPEPAEGFGNKLSILGGDFLLGRASAALARLGESEVVELVGCVISNIVEGEILRMKDVCTPTLGQLGGPTTLEEAWSSYLKKTYLKTASLIAKSARASVILGGCGAEEAWKDVAYAYGHNLGIAYQVCSFNVVLSTVG